jgi:hypothetical protein
MTKKPSRAEEADKQNHPSPSPASDELILPKPKPDIRPLSETELEKLETALGKRVERQYLAYWVAEATRDIARLSVLPTPKQLNIDLKRMAGDGFARLRNIPRYSHLRSATHLTAWRKLPHHSSIASTSWLRRRQPRAGLAARVRISGYWRGPELVVFPVYSNCAWIFTRKA